MMKNICRYALGQYFKKLKISLLTTVMMAIAIGVMFYSFIIYGFYHYPERLAEGLLQDKPENVYYLKYHMLFAPVSNDELNRFYDFYNNMGSIEGIEKFGMYAFLPNYDFDEMYIQNNISALCRVEDINGKGIHFEYNEKYGEAYVGFSMSDRYPVGSIYTTSSGEQYIIKNVLKKDAEWLFENKGDSSINLNNAVLLDYDYLLKNHITKIYNGINSFYYVAKDKDVSGKVMGLAKEYGLAFEDTYDLKSDFHIYAKKSMRDNGEAYFFPVIVYLAAVIAIGMSAMLSLYNSMTDYGIMLANGFTRREIIGIVITENIYKCLLAGMIAFVYWMRNHNKFIGAFHEAMITYIPHMTVFCILSVFVISIFPVVAFNKWKLHELVK